MTTEVDITNRALQAIGSQSTITSLTEQSNEAVQAKLVIDQLRDDLLRMAPWDCCTAYANLVYITSVAGTPENTSAGTTLWQPGVPAPPWAYEYQYPVDCLRAVFVVPQFQTGFSGGIPITTAVTGGAPAFWQGPPQKFKITTDLFYPVLTATPNAGGEFYNVGDVLTLMAGPNTEPPIGAPVQLIVTGETDGAVTDVDVINQVSGSATPQGGSYFTHQINTPIPVGTVQNPGGVTFNTQGSGATFDLTYGPRSSQRVILTNQEFATLCYNRQITDPNVMDPMFIDAWTMILASRLVIAITGDKALANMKIAEANRYVEEARKADGNEGLTVNNITPDWIRARGIDFSDDVWGNSGYDYQWGNSFPMYT